MIFIEGDSTEAAYPGFNPAENGQKVFNKIVSDNLIILENFLQKYKDLFSWVKPEGGCIGFVHYKKNETVDFFTQKLLEKTGILLMPAFIFDFKSNHFRIGFGRYNMNVALKKLEQYIESIR